MKKKRRIKHTYGSDRYKGFVLVKNEDGSLNKHYIAGVDYMDWNPGYVSLSVHTAHDDQEHMEYKLGSNTSADIGIKTWYRTRQKNKMWTGSYNKDYDKWCHTNTKINKKRKRKKK